MTFKLFVKGNPTQFSGKKFKNDTDGRNLQSKVLITLKLIYSRGSETMSGKIFALLVLGLFLLFILGNASAGSEADPEVTDPEGDAPDRLSGENVSHLDILAAWFHSETTTHIWITLKFSSLDVIVNPTGTTLSIRRIGWQYANSEKPDLWWYAQVETTDNIHQSAFTYFLEGNQTRRDTERGCFCGRNKSTPGTFVLYIEKDNIGNPEANTTLTNIFCETFEARQQTYSGKDWLFHLVDNTTYGKDFTLNGGKEESKENDTKVNKINYTWGDEELNDSDGTFIPGFSGLGIIIIVVIVIFVRKRHRM